MQLAPQRRMLWLAVGAAQEQGEGMEGLLLRLASILRYTADLDRRLAADGLGGLTPLRELHERVTRVLAALAPGVTVARQTVGEMITSLHAMDETLAAIRRLKSELQREP
jgi:hypothetical protein